MISSINHRHGWLAAMLLACCLLAGSVPAGPVFIEKAAPPSATEGGVLFVFEAPDASQVYLAGDFNNWGNNHDGKVSDPAAAMQKSSPNNIWYKVVDLPSGHAAYKFVVADKDGNCAWHTNPLVPETDGSGNSVYDPANKTALHSLWSNPAIRVLASEAKNEVTVSFLTGSGGIRQSLILAPIIMDGEAQTGMKADPAHPGRIGNGTIWVSVEEAGDRSVAVTYGADDGGVHDWELRFPGSGSYYGGGERFNSVNQKGYYLPMVSLDHPGEKGVASYKPVPFMMSTSGFGVWVDSFTPGAFDLEASSKDICSFRYKEDKLRVVFIAGPQFGEILKEYTALTGRAPVPPVWSFAPWKSRNVHKNREEVLEDVEKYRELDLPASVLVIDSPWERGYNDFVLNDEQFTDPKAMFDRVQELGFYTCLWLTPFVNTKNVQDMKGITGGVSSNFQEGADNGYFVKNASGDVMISSWWKGEGGLVDFTNPAAVEWWLNQLDKAQELGVKAWKCDDGEGGTFVSGEAVSYDGTRPDVMKGKFGYLYLEVMQKHIDERLGGDGVLFARPGFAGTQKFPYCWAGDNHAGWDFDNGLPGVIRAGQTAALSGIALWAHDIAGYHGTQTPELFNRWTQFGCFSPMMQLHMTSNLGPWSFGDESLAIYRKYAKLHTQLFPYIYAAAKEAHETGMPIIRPMVLAFQNDNTASHEEFQYMFGPDILVAPIYQPVTHRSVYLPGKVTWIDWWTGESIVGGKYIETHTPMDRIPLFVRAGSVIPMLPPDVDTLVPRTDKMAKDVVAMDDRRIVQVWPGADANATAEGVSVRTVTRQDGSVTLSLSVSPARPLQVHLMHHKLQAAEAGSKPADACAWDENLQATVLSWQSISGEARIELAKP